MTKIVGFVAYLHWEEINANPQMAWHISMLTIVGLWIIPALVCAYRTVGYNYRLTSRRLFRDLGFRHPASPGIDLSQVKDVRAKYTIYERWLGIGDVSIATEGSPQPLILFSVARPDAVAELIRKQCEKGE